MTTKALPPYIILIDFGSTFTKMVIVNTLDKTLVSTRALPSTVVTDGRIGLNQCFTLAKEILGETDFIQALKLASSSAAGGLRMAVIGLSQTLSLNAGRSVAFSAGGKILKTCWGRLSPENIRELESLNLEIILFCGGYERSDTVVLEHNASMLAQSNIHIPIIFAGNSAAEPMIRRIFTFGRKEFYITRNIIPQVGSIQKEEAESIIRDIFLHRIINMKGLDKVSAMLDKMVMPTPVAVLKAGELLSKGTEKIAGLGDLMMVDVGGATTDVHSYASQLAYEGAKILGAPESFSKRTVEGDLGMRESSQSLANEIGISKLSAQLKTSESQVKEILSRWVTSNKSLAFTDLEQKLDHLLAQGAVRISARRHAGRIEKTLSSGVKTIQQGKNLTSVKYIIGTGGQLVFAPNSRDILLEILRKSATEPEILLPEKATFMLDKNYILFAAGLLQEVDADLAITLLKANLTEI